MFVIDFNSPVSLSDQIFNQILIAVRSEKILKNEYLPPASELAGILRINPNVIKDAYDRLVRHRIASWPDDSISPVILCKPSEITLNIINQSKPDSKKFDNKLLLQLWGQILDLAESMGTDRDKVFPMLDQLHKKISKI